MPRLPQRRHSDSRSRTASPSACMSIRRRFKDSIHGSMFTCVDCHTDVKSSPHETPPQTNHLRDLPRRRAGCLRPQLPRQGCQAGNTKAATCVDCHGSPHELLPASDPKSRVHHTNIPATCGACHSQKFVMQDSGQSAQTGRLLSAERSRTCRRRRFGEGSGLHRLPRHARDSRRQRFEVSHLQIQRAD